MVTWKNLFKFKLQCSNGSLYLLLWLINLYMTWPLPCSIHFQPFSPISPCLVDNFMGLFMPQASLLALPYALVFSQATCCLPSIFCNSAQMSPVKRSSLTPSPKVISLFLFQLLCGFICSTVFYYYSDNYLIFLKCVCCQ